MYRKEKVKSKKIDIINIDDVFLIDKGWLKNKKYCVVNIYNF